MNFISYKDPDARVVLVSGKYYRKIHKNFVSDFRGFIDSGLYQELVDANLMIKHEQVTEFESDEFPIVILPQQISYHILPFEWSEKMWSACLASYLKINKIALGYGYILKDATPYNFAFIDGNMQMFDTSSFIPFKEGDSWIAYRQFCEEMLGPYLLIKYNGVGWSKLFLGAIRGLSLDFVSKNLPFSSIFNLTALIHIHLHKQFSNQRNQLNQRAKQPQKVFSIKSLQTLMESLLTGISDRGSKKVGHWKDYYVNYLESDTYLFSKKEIISNWLQDLQTNSVTDLGANTGEFTFLASSLGNQVLALEADPVCVDVIVNQIKEKNIQNVTPGYIDLTQVSPSVGNNLKEYTSLFERGKSDMVFALAIIHHLAITFSFTFSQILDLFSSFSNRYVIVEFVPRSDEKVQILLENRGRDFEEYTQENFEFELKSTCHLIEKIQIPGSERMLYLVEKIDE